MDPNLSPANAPPSTEAPRSLDEQIRDAEMRLMLRETRLRHRANGLGEQVRAAWRPQRLVWPALGVGLGLGALWWAARRPAALRQARGTHAPSSHTSHAPWLQGLLALWPLLPAPWRAWANPALLAGLIERWADPTRRTPPPLTMAQVDLDRYAGDWFELARLPNHFEADCSGPPSARYMPVGGELLVTNRCQGRDGRERIARGVARAVPGSANAKLEVSFFPRALRWLPFVWAPYWVLHVDAGYRWALVGHPNRRYLWLLAREPRIEPQRLQRLLELAAAQGYDVSRLHYPGAVPAP